MSHVTVNASSGPNQIGTATVPNTVGQTLQQAVSTLNGAGLRLIFVKVPTVSPASVGKVASEPWAVNVRDHLATADTYQYEDNVEGAKWQVTAREFDLVGSDDKWTIMIAVPPGPNAL